jgi:hypothetical protein
MSRTNMAFFLEVAGSAGCRMQMQGFDDGSTNTPEDQEKDHDISR